MAGSRPAYVYIPAFSLLRPVVQRLGAALCVAQPVLETAQGLPSWARTGPSSAGDPDEPWSMWDGPGPGEVSPVVVGRKDARVLAQFVYLAVESRDGSDLVSAASDMEVGAEELIFIPATWDPRCIHESSWRLLLREFDDLVA